MPATELTQLPASIRVLIERIEADAPLTPPKVKRLLAESDITEQDLEPWADYDHPDTDSYGRKLIWDGGHFELMAMSWRDGDYSAIHDHGYTQWGAVKLFGAAEHAVFSLKNGRLETMDRTVQASGTVLSVGHDLIHQMGNVGQPNYLTLHLYGCEGRDGGITADARIFDLDEGTIQFTGGGVFFHLPEEKIVRREPGLDGDLSTRLRHDTEKWKRIHLASDAGSNGAAANGRDSSTVRARLEKKIFSKEIWPELDAEIEACLGADGQVEPSSRWRVLFRELQAAAEVQRLRDGSEGESERLEAELWDEAIGPRHLEHYVAEYLRFIRERFQIDLPRAAVLSIGCRTGLVEAFLQSELGLSGERLLGLEPSEQMLRIAVRRLRAEALDPLKLASQSAGSSLILAGVHSLQRPGSGSLEATIEAIAGLTLPGGHFVGDFVWPRPDLALPEASVWRGERSLLLEQDLRSEVGSTSSGPLNEYLDVSLSEGGVSYRASREAVDPGASFEAVYPLFERCFGGRVHLFDALTLEPVGPPSGRKTNGGGTRVLLVAEKPA